MNGTTTLVFMGQLHWDNYSLLEERPVNILKTMSTPRFAVVIPAYNHGASVKGVIESALKLHIPVFVMDDGSTDSTAEAARSCPEAVLLQNQENMGKGAALLKGFEAASQKADYAITIDADGQHNPSDAIPMMNSIKAGVPTLVIGRRENMLNDATIAWTSRFGRKFSNFWVWAAGGPWLSDSQSGFRIYPIAEVLRLKSRARRFQFEVEILVLAHWMGIPIIEVPVNVTYQAGEGRVSHFRPFVDFWRNAFTFTRLIVMRLLLPMDLRKRILSR